MQKEAMQKEAMQKEAMQKAQKKAAARESDCQLIFTLIGSLLRGGVSNA
jgi:hypothetical protein